MRSFIACASSVLFALAAFAAPMPQEAAARFPGFPLPKCKAPLPPIPANQTQLVLTAGQTTEIAAFGMGTQNYTCGADGKYASFGAEATLFDVSCFMTKPLLPLFQPLSKAVQGLQATNPDVSSAFSRCLGGLPGKVGTHYFRPNPSGSGIQPVFIVKDKTFVGAKKGNFPNPPAVDLLQLNKVEGTIVSNNVFRMYTTGGAAPTSCTPGSANIKVPYTAVYFFVQG